MTVECSTDTAGPKYGGIEVWVGWNSNSGEAESSAAVRSASYSAAMS